MTDDLFDCLEIWKDVVGYEGLYKVSNFGRVMSVSGGRWGSGAKKCRSLIKHSGGYLCVNLCKDGETKGYKVHRLVAEAFIPNPMHLETVNHLDEDKQNNHVNNLEWKSVRDNINYGTHNQRMAETLRNGPLAKPVKQFTTDGAFVKWWPSLCEVRRVCGYCTALLSICCRKNNRTAYGYKWQYA